MRFAVIFALAAIASSARCASVRRLASVEATLCHMYAPGHEDIYSVTIQGDSWSSNVTGLAYLACKPFTWDGSATSASDFTVTVRGKDGAEVGTATGRFSANVGRPVTVLTTSEGIRGIAAASSRVSISSSQSVSETFNTVKGSGYAAIKWEAGGNGGAIKEGSQHDSAIPAAAAGMPGSMTITLENASGHDATLWTASGAAPGPDKRMSIIVHGEKGQTGALEPAVKIVGDNWIGSSSAAAVSTPFAAVALMITAMFASRFHS